MTSFVASPPKRIDPDALIEEARRHRRQRLGRLLLALIVLIALAGTAYGIVASAGGSTQAKPGGGLVAAGHTAAVVLVVDVSGSMRATDVKPTRLDAAVRAMQALIARLPDRVQVGLVSFSTGAKIVAQPTHDHAAVARALATLQPEAGTALGDGLAAAVKLTLTTLDKAGIRRDRSGLLPAAIVLESDGAQNRGTVTPLDAARQAKTAGIHVDGVALGTAGGTVKFGFGQYQNSIPVPPDPKTVAQVSHLTGGSSFVAQTAARLAAIYRELGTQLGR